MNKYPIENPKYSKQELLEMEIEELKEEIKEALEFYKMVKNRKNKEK